MNETSEQNSENTTTTEENVFLPNISSDNNANRSDSNIRQNKVVTENKISIQNTVNGVDFKIKLKVNNNLPESLVKNGTSNIFKDTFIQNNVDSQFEKPCPVSNFEATNGYRYSVNNVSSCSKNLDKSDLEHYTNGLQYEPDDSKHSPGTSNAEPGPSSSCLERKLPSVLSNHSIRNIDSDDCSSDTGNDELSCCDDGCIYTYKGDDIADLPRSFMNLGHPDNIDEQDGSRAGSRGSSPEMDFLEMDFDPGPSCDAESDESSTNIELRETENITHDKNIEVEQECSSLENDFNQETEQCCLKQEQQEEPQPCCSKSLPVCKEENVCDEINNLSPNVTKVINMHNTKPTVTIVNNKAIVENIIDYPWIPKCALQRTKACTITQDSKGHHSSSGDLIPWTSENLAPSASSECRINTPSSLYHSTMEKKLVLDKEPSNVESTSFIEKTMIWTEQEAALKQVTQIGTSACGATAVINVLQALGYEIPTNDKVIESVETRLRSNASPLVKYLKSRSVAGSTHKDLIKGLQKLTNGKIYARFFNMYPERYINLSLWLSYWIKKGAVPIVTLNLQKGVACGGSIPDAWHHQMVFGVGPHGVYMTNPLERVEEGLLWHQLTSESVLLIKKDDVISRFDFQKSLNELKSIKEVRWRRLNVVGQTINVVREHRLKYSTLSRTHVCIPASYEAGITLAINVSNPASEMLKTCPELPVLGTLP